MLLLSEIWNSAGFIFITTIPRINEWDTNNQIQLSDQLCSSSIILVLS